MSLEPASWLLAIIGAVLIGLGKGGLPGIGNITIVVYAVVFPAKESVGILLPVLIAADVIAVITYRAHAQWRYVVKLMPWTVVGVLVGALLMNQIDGKTVQRLIGIILVSMTALHFFRKWKLRDALEKEDSFVHSKPFIVGTGVLGGFATMIANAAGPIAALYFLAIGLPKMHFLGTGAWFFFIINMFKVPFQVGIGNINLDSIMVSLTLAPFACIGAVIAPQIVRFINQSIFEKLIWFFIIVGGLKLLLDIRIEDLFLK